MKTAFQLWSHANLIKFAVESYARMAEQDARIKTLEDDLRVAIDSYRLLMRRTAPSQLPPQ